MNESLPAGAYESLRTRGLARTLGAVPHAGCGTPGKAVLTVLDFIGVDDLARAALYTRLAAPDGPRFSLVA